MSRICNDLKGYTCTTSLHFHANKLRGHLYLSLCKRKLVLFTAFFEKNIHLKKKVCLLIPPGEGIYFYILATVGLRKMRKWKLSRVKRKCTQWAWHTALLYLCSAPPCPHPTPLYSKHPRELPWQLLQGLSFLYSVQMVSGQTLVAHFISWFNAPLF